jgi:hypothetical protein
MKTESAQQQDAEIPFRPDGVVQDCFFLSLVVALSLILYIQGLGFYSDDWYFLGRLGSSQDQSLGGLFRSIYSPWVQMRPVQILYVAGLYWLFGPHPFGYHMVNAAVFLAGIVLFYLVLRELGQRRVLALTVSVAYALLPHYCTDRFWVIAFVANLSMALYFLSLYADLRSLRARSAPLWAWKCLSILSLLGSSLAYEVFLPLFLLNPLLIWYRIRQIYSVGPDKQLSLAKLAVLLGSNVPALIGVLVFKGWTTVRLGDQSGFKEHAAWFLKQAIVVNYGDYGLGLPRVVATIVRDYPDWATFVVGGALGIFIFAYLYFVARQSKVELLSQTSMVGFIVLGLVVFGLGYTIFLITRNAQSSPTGISNRVAIAAAVGVAFSLVGAVGWVSAFLPSARLRRQFFSMAVAMLCTSGFLIINTVASFWVDAYRKEQAILVEIRQRFPTLPSGSTLILDGICPYVGPAIVFESNWDLAGALMMLYDDLTLRADIVTPNLKVKEDGLSTLLYGSLHSHYPYDEKLFVYHIVRKATHRLTDAKAARRYFESFNPSHDNDCPTGREGHGVPIFWRWGN